MKLHRTFVLTAIIALLVGLPLSAQWAASEKVDLDAVYRIKDEGLQRSKVMEIESYLTDVYGPRLTGGRLLRRSASDVPSAASPRPISTRSQRLRS